MHGLSSFSSVDIVLACLLYMCEFVKGYWTKVTQRSMDDAAGKSHWKLFHSSAEKTEMIPKLSAERMREALGWQQRMIELFYTHIKLDSLMRPVAIHASSNESRQLADGGIRLEGFQVVFPQTHRNHNLAIGRPRQEKH